jgi:anti-sigma factor RsiW
MKITDEILNRYLDGDLNEQEAAGVNSALAASEELRKKFNTLRLVHNQLSSIAEDEVSADFTAKLINRLSHKFEVPRQQKYFIAAISFVIVIICLGIVAYITSAVLAAASSGSGSSQFLESFNKISSMMISDIEKLFKGKSLSIIGSVFSFAILISGYFFFEYQKRTKANLSR